MKKLKGIGLLELMLSLAVIAVLLVGATRYYKVTAMSERINRVVGLMQAVNAAAVKWQAANGTYNGISTEKLIKDGYLPGNFIADKAGVDRIKNPWGGDVLVSGVDNDRHVQVTLTKLPNDACRNIANKLQDIVATKVPNRCGTSESTSTYTGVFQ